MKKNSIDTHKKRESQETGLFSMSKSQLLEKQEMLRECVISSLITISLTLLTLYSFLNDSFAANEYFLM